MIVPVVLTLLTGGLVYASRTSVGDEVQPYDIVLVPLEKFPANSPELTAGIRSTIDALAQAGRKGSFALRVDQANRMLVGTPMGVFDDVGNGEYTMVGSERFKDVPFSRDLVVGILKRGVPLGAGRPGLEKGSFV